MTPETFVQRLSAAAPEGLKSVVLYGSAVAGDFVPGESTFNVLIVVDRLGRLELDAIASPVADWTKAGNEPPLLLTVDELDTLCEAFPIELADIRQSRKTLFGPDLVTGMAADEGYLSLQLQRELKGKLFALRRHYLQDQGDTQRLATLLTRSLSTFLVLFRAALRLYQPEVPASKLDAAMELAAHVPFDPQPLREIHDLKTGKKQWHDYPLRALFGDYLRAIESVVAAVDQHVQAKSP